MESQAIKFSEYVLKRDQNFTLCYRHETKVRQCIWLLEIGLPKASQINFMGQTKTKKHPSVRAKFRDTAAFNF